MKKTKTKQNKKKINKKKKKNNNKNSRMDLIGTGAYNLVEDFI